jgi:hypothetical protein
MGLVIDILNYVLRQAQDERLVVDSVRGELVEP